MTNIAHLIRLANRIASFFCALPNHSDGVEGVADHIQKFWAPRMRLALLQFLDEHPEGKTGDAVLDPLALEALTLNKSRLMPAQA